MGERVYEEGPPNPGLLPYRVFQIESWRREIDAWRLGVDADRGDFKRGLADLATIKRLLVGILISFVTGTASVITLIIVSTGKV